MKNNDFFSYQPIAIIGVSRDDTKFSYVFFNKLIKNGYNVVPVNPNVDEINNIKCYKTILDTPKDIKAVIIMTKSKYTDQILKDTINLGIKNIWIQQESETEETMKIIAQHPDCNIISNSCVFMHSKPLKGMHDVQSLIKTLIYKEKE